MKQSELNKILDLHELWIKTKGKEGERADLSGRNLMFLDFSGRNLRKANLFKANLREARLRRSNLYKANLKESDLVRAYLYKANLVGANLERAILERAQLFGAKLFGANLEDAILCKVHLWSCIGNNREIKNIDDLSYSIVYTSKVLQIGCENHTFEEWKNFTDKEIDEMDYGAIEFWKKNKDYIFETIENSPAI